MRRQIGRRLRISSDDISAPAARGKSKAGVAASATGSVLFNIPASNRTSLPASPFYIHVDYCTAAPMSIDMATLSGRSL
jgi:hypothetical protein